MPTGAVDSCSPVQAKVAPQVTRPHRRRRFPGLPLLTIFCIAKTNCRVMRLTLIRHAVSLVYHIHDAATSSAHCVASDPLGSDQRQIL